MAFACGAAIVGGLLIRFLLPQFLLRMDFYVVVLRSGMLCLIGLSIYLIIARLLGVHELSEVQRLMGRKFKRPKVMHPADDVSS